MADAKTLRGEVITYFAVAVATPLDFAVIYYGPHHPEAIHARQLVVTAIRMLDLTPNERKLFQMAFHRSLTYMHGEPDQDDLFEEGLGDA